MAPERDVNPAGTLAHGIAVVAHDEHAMAGSCAREVGEWCGRRGIDVWAAPDDAAVLGLPDLAAERPLGTASLVVSIGGDGTMLRSVRMLAGAPVPLLGVNVGSLGYLTEIEPDQIGDALERVGAGADAGRWRLDERMMLDVALNGRPVGCALNEAVVEKHLSGHTVRLLARLDGEPFTHYVADGLIVATPTGSTAYSMSARGPIVSPGHRAILLTPVAAHMLFDRTLVLDPREVVDVEVTGHRAAQLVIDGASVATLAEGDVVTCAPSARTAAFVRLGPDRYHQVLKSKFGLTER
jgi:NAD+ kinase